MKLSILSSSEFLNYFSADLIPVSLYSSQEFREKMLACIDETYQEGYDAGFEAGFEAGEKDQEEYGNLEQRIADLESDLDDMRKERDKLDSSYDRLSDDYDELKADLTKCIQSVKFING